METIDNVMCHSGNFYNDRGEIRLHSDTLQKLQKRSSRCDAAITETEPYFEDCRRQFALIEGASHSGSKKTWSDSLKVIQAGRDALAVIQRTSFLSRSALREIGVPVFVYSGMFTLDLAVALL